ncbi:heterokaryon incompatibility protein-domain-containing protein [Aspergillus recurvatus]
MSAILPPAKGAVSARDNRDNDALTWSQLHPWSNVEKCWPRRLLHIPTMTSFERRGESTYGTVNEPQYGIISYTWGRWESKTASSIKINGTPWKIPAVAPEHFTPEMLQAVIHQVGKDVEYVWIDIACIDQEDQGTKMDEIGRQVGIFARATRTYVWLSHLQPDSMFRNLNELTDLIYSICFRNEDDWRIPQDVIRRISECFNFLFEDPWFSSLWTLQEFTLNRTALILSRDGRPVRRRTPSGHFFLLALANDSFNLLRELESIESKWPLRVQGVRNEIENIRLQCRRAGFQSALVNNPNVQYELVQYRTTTRLEDRIYGISQIYQLKVGQSLQPSMVFTLDELRDQFAEALVTQYPAISQLFIHRDRPRPGQTWRITETCVVPKPFLVVGKGASLCKFKLTTAKSIICNGLACLLCDLDKVPLTQVLEIFLDREVEKGLSLSRHLGFPLSKLNNARIPLKPRDVLNSLATALGPHRVMVVPLILNGVGLLTGMLLSRIDMRESAQWERLGIFTIQSEVYSKELLDQCVEFCGEIF